jgi:hypothetical protein
MAKVTDPLLSVSASGRVGRMMIHRFGGVVTKYHRPKNTNSILQIEHRAAFKAYYMSSLTQAQADLLYAAIIHEHDDLYSLLAHGHDHGALSGLGDDDHTQYHNNTRGDARYSVLAHTHAGGSAIVNNYLTGLTLSNDVTDPTNDIAIAAGYCADSTNADMLTGAAIIKRLDAAWSVGTNQGGLDTGAIANATYHVWLIKRSDTGVVDALFSTSATAPTMPANYDYKRRVGSIVRLAGVIKAFIQDGDLFMWSTPVLDVNATNPGTNAVTRTLTVPTGVRVRAQLSALGYGTSNAAYTNNVYISDLSVADTAASATAGAWSFTAYWTPAGEFAIGSPVSAMTNTSAQVRSRIQYSAAGTTLFILTNGWIDLRGKA